MEPGRITVGTHLVKAIPFWLETTQRVNNKVGNELEAFWDNQHSKWGKATNRIREDSLSIHKEGHLG